MELNGGPSALRPFGCAQGKPAQGAQDKKLLFNLICMKLSISTTGGLSVEVTQGCGVFRLGWDMDLNF
jgi:hypothetical protein